MGGGKHKGKGFGRKLAISKFRAITVSSVLHRGCREGEQEI